MLSFWEKNSFIDHDYIIIGSGLMGLHIAYELIEKEPNAKVVVLERGVFPSGASTKNAGFACFGSLTEILSDFTMNGVEKTLETIKERYEGIELLCQRLGKNNVGYEANGGYELIFEKDLLSLDKLEEVNKSLFPIFQQDVFELVNEKIEQFGFDPDKVKALIYNCFEGQIDTGKMMQSFLKLVSSKGVQILTGCEALTIHETDSRAVAEVSHNVLKERLCFSAKKIFVCTNALLNMLYKEEIVKPGRGQIFVTKPIPNLPFKGVFHFDEGFYYFRNYEDRVIFGGGRNLDFIKEESQEFEYNEMVLENLKAILTEVILPHVHVEIELQWTGIMGFTMDKNPIIKKQSDKVIVAMSCNGMGVALTGISAKKALLLLD
jgi:glycine/D-amino acid oxidase-like deaminating enzyme